MVAILAGIGEGIKAILRFPFVALAWLLSLVSSLLARMLLILALLIAIPASALAGYWLLDYSRNAYRFAPSGKCGLKDKLFPNVVLDFSYSCVDASKYQEEGYANFVFFMSNEDNPTPGRHGHGWLALMRVSEKPDGLRLHQWQVFGFRGNGEFNCSSAIVSAYGFIAPFVPFRTLIEANYKAFCMGGVSEFESDNRIASVEGVPPPRIETPEQVHTLLARRPAQLFAVAIDNEQFNNVLWLSSEASRRSYSVLLSDCTTLLYRIAQSAGLYTPPRMLYPFPSQSVEALRQFNTQ